MPGFDLLSCWHSGLTLGRSSCGARRCGTLAFELCLTLGCNWTDFQLIAEGSTNACAIGFPFFTCHAFVNQVCSRRYASSQLALWTCGGVTPYTARNWLRSDEGSIKKFAARRCHLRIQEPKCKFVYSWREPRICSFKVCCSLTDHSESILLACNRNDLWSYIIWSCSR